jgi:hypothetical protein
MSKCLNAFVKVNMANHKILVAVSYWLIIKLNYFIFCMYLVTIHKSS